MANRSPDILWRKKDTNDYAYEYDYANRVVRIYKDINSNRQFDTGDTEYAQYEYDAFGRRIKTHDIIGSDTRYYYYSSDQQVLAEYDNCTSAANLIQWFVYGNYIDEVVARNTATPAANMQYYVQNLQYSVTALRDSNGNMLEQYDYDAYGRVRVYTDSDNDGNWFNDSDDTIYTFSQADNPYLFTGRRLDIINNGSLTIYYYRARHYDPSTGRFLQYDPLGYADGMNLYEYVLSNPLNYVDPFGLSIYSNMALSITLQIDRMIQENSHKIVLPSSNGDIVVELNNSTDWTPEKALYRNNNSSVNNGILEIAGTEGAEYELYALVTSIEFRKKWYENETLRLSIDNDYPSGAPCIRFFRGLAYGLMLDTHADREQAAQDIIWGTIELLSFGTCTSAAGNAKAFNYADDVLQFADDATGVAARQTLMHYTKENNLPEILKSGVIKASQGIKNARYGSGQYFTDISPEAIGGATRATTPAGKMSLGQLSSKLYGIPYNSSKLQSFIEIDATNLPINQVAPNIFLHESDEALNITTIIIRSGRTLP